MASIVKWKHKHKTTYLCFIRRKGFKTLRKTFQTRQDAQKWSRYIERNLDSGISSDFSEASRAMIKDLLKRYLKEHKHKHKKGWRMEEYYLIQSLVLFKNQRSIERGLYLFIQDKA